MKAGPIARHVRAMEHCQGFDRRSALLDLPTGMILPRPAVLGLSVC